MTMTKSSAEFRIAHGRHQGKKLNQVPVGYLRWMVNVKHGNADLASAELKRRGTIKPEIDISGHAIDRASQRLLKKWKSCGMDIGLYSWLAGMAKQALDHGVKTVNDCGVSVKYQGIKFMFQMDCEWPVLKTVVVVKNQRQSQS